MWSVKWGWYCMKYCIILYKLEIEYLSKITNDITQTWKFLTLSPSVTLKSLLYMGLHIYRHEIIKPPPLLDAWRHLWMSHKAFCKKFSSIQTFFFWLSLVGLKRGWGKSMACPNQSQYGVNGLIVFTCQWLFVWKLTWTLSQESPSYDRVFGAIHKWRHSALHCLSHNCIGDDQARALLLPPLAQWRHYWISPMIKFLMEGVCISVVLHLTEI